MSFTSAQHRAGRELPRGPHKLPRAEVLASQRARLVEAMLDLVGEHGYAATRVGDVVRRARVSRNAFYELFDDREDCFVAVCEEAGNRLIEELYGLGERESWTEAVNAGVIAYVRFWQERPGYARAYLVESRAAGPRARAMRERVFLRFVELWEALGAWIRAAEPAAPSVGLEEMRLMFEGIEGAVAHAVASGRLNELDDLAPVLERYTTRMLTGG